MQSPPAIWTIASVKGERAAVLSRLWTKLPSGLSLSEVSWV
jgi:hypothetical protein